MTDLNNLKPNFEKDYIKTNFSKKFNILIHNFVKCLTSNPHISATSTMVL